MFLINGSGRGGTEGHDRSRAGAGRCPAALTKVVSGRPNLCRQPIACLPPVAEWRNPWWGVMRWAGLPAFWIVTLFGPSSAVMLKETREDA